MILFFNLIKGRYKSFYCPSWVNDFTPISNIEFGSVYIDAADTYRYYGSTSRKKHVIVFTKDWKSYILEIMNITVETVNDKRIGKIIFVSASKIELDNILMISYLNLVRFDSDDLKINYESTEVANVNLSFAEVDDK